MSAPNLANEVKAFTEAIADPRLPGVFKLNYTKEYKQLFALAYGNESTDPNTRHSARLALCRDLDKIINIIRPTQEIYMQYLMEEEVVDNETLPTYFLRERVATEVDYLNTHDLSMHRTRIEPGTKFTIVPLAYAETAQWSRFDYFADLRPRDEALAQLKLSMDVARSRHWWTLAQASSQSVASTQSFEHAGVFTLSAFRSLLAIFSDAGYGNMLTSLQIVMNSESYEQLFNDCVTKLYPFSEVLKMVGKIHVVPLIYSAKNQYSMYIPNWANAVDITYKARIFAFLPFDYSKEFVIKTGGQPVYYEDYVPDAAGWEAGVKAMARISRLIVDRAKCAFAKRIS